MPTAARAADKVSCLSCHTSVSYALGRPALRHVAGEDRPTAHESAAARAGPAPGRALGRARHARGSASPTTSTSGRRSNRGAPRRSSTPWSWPGTTAAAASPPRAIRPGRPSAISGRPSTRTARKPARGTGSTSGSVPGRPARPLLRGDARRHRRRHGPRVSQGRGRRDRERASTGSAGTSASQLEKQNLHNRLFALWASTAIDGLLTADQRQQIIEQVLAKQQENGGWSLSSLVDCKRQDGTPQETGSGRLRHGPGAARPPARRRSPRISPPSAGDWRGSAPISSRTGNWVGVSLNKRRDPKTHVGKFMSDAATAFAILALEDH